jgi:hypothetical protein
VRDAVLACVSTDETVLSKIREFLREHDKSSNFSITEDKLATLISDKLLKDESFVRDVCSVVVEQNRTRKVSKFDYNFYLIDNF